MPRATARKCSSSCGAAGSSAGNDACEKGTFAEQVPGLTVRYARHTCSLDGVLQAVAMTLGIRLTGRLACAVSRSTLIRLIRARPGC